MHKNKQKRLADLALIWLVSHDREAKAKKELEAAHVDVKRAEGMITDCLTDSEGDLIINVDQPLLVRVKNEEGEISGEVLIQVDEVGHNTLWLYEWTGEIISPEKRSPRYLKKVNDD